MTSGQLELNLGIELYIVRGRQPGQSSRWRYAPKFSHAAPEPLANNVDHVQREQLQPDGRSGLLQHFKADHDLRSIYVN